MGDLDRAYGERGGGSGERLSTGQISATFLVTALLTGVIDFVVLSLTLCGFSLAVPRLVDGAGLLEACKWAFLVSAIRVPLMFAYLRISFRKNVSQYLRQGHVQPHPPMAPWKKALGRLAFYAQVTVVSIVVFSLSVPGAGRVVTLTAISAIVSGVAEYLVAGKKGLGRP